MMNFIISNLPWFWLGLLIVCAVIESFTLSLTTIWAGIACIPLIFISKTPLSFKWQLLIFVVLTLILVISTRPFALKKLKLGKEKTNVSTMIGQEVLVVKKITKFEKGEVKAKNGVIWSATSKITQEIPENSICTIVSIDGNTVDVEIKDN